MLNISRSHKFYFSLCAKGFNYLYVVEKQLQDPLEIPVLLGRHKLCVHLSEIGIQKFQNSN